MVLERASFVETDAGASELRDNRGRLSREPKAEGVLEFSGIGPGPSTGARKNAALLRNLDLSSDTCVGAAPKHVYLALECNDSSLLLFLLRLKYDVSP